MKIYLARCARRQFQENLDVGVGNNVAVATVAHPLRPLR
jgi:hypothetical protein